MRTLDITENDAKVPYDGLDYVSTKEIVHPIFNGGYCFGRPGSMDHDECKDIKAVVVKTGNPSTAASGDGGARAKGHMGAKADNPLIPDKKKVVGMNPGVVDDIPGLPGDPEPSLVPVPSISYPDLLPTTWTDEPTGSSTIASTTESSAPPTTLSSAEPPASPTSSTAAPSSTSEVEPPPPPPPPSTTTTEEPPEPTETETEPPPFHPGTCKAAVTEYGYVDGFMAKITIYDDADEVVGDNSDTVDFDYDGKFGSGWDPILWDSYYWIHSEPLGTNMTFTFTMNYIETRQDSYLAFTKWNVIASIDDQLEWDFSALDEEVLPHARIGEWTYDGSEEVFPADEASVSLKFPLVS